MAGRRGAARFAIATLAVGVGTLAGFAVVREHTPAHTTATPKPPLRSSPTDTPWVATWHNEPVRWSCGTPITWAVSTAAPIPSGGLTTVRQAFKRIATTSGLRFAYDGSLPAVPGPGWRPPRGGPEVLIGWIPRSANPIFAPPAPTDALAMAEDLSTGPRLVGAVVDYSPQAYRKLQRGFGRGTTQGALVLHELMHVVGVGDQTRWPGDLSFGQLIARPTATFGAGDLAALRRLGCQ